jgi:pyruvate/2-oxoglutarate dehydrogenase complex dihydrolipoamide dehydrogenase (E3) component
LASATSDALQVKERRPGEQRSIIAADMIIAIGSAMSLPAMPGAEPSDGSNKPLLSAPNSA